MSLKSTILALNPTSYWPLNDAPGSRACLDAMGLKNAMLPTTGTGVTLAAVPFGASAAPLFDGALGSRLTILSVPQYSQCFANALTVAVWICPLALNNTNTAGSGDQYVHFLEKAVTPVLDTEWAMRFYNQNTSRPSRLSFYMFNLAATAANPTNKGAGSYMQFGVSTDATPVTVGNWLFLVGEAEPWISTDDQTTGCILWKQDVESQRSWGDKYENPEFQVHPQAGEGPLSVGGTAETGFNGAIAHLALWNRLLSQDEIDQMWTQGSADLQATPS